MEIKNNSDILVGNEKIINKSLIQKAVPLFVYSETATAHENTAAAKKNESPAQKSPVLSVTKINESAV